MYIGVVVVVDAVVRPVGIVVVVVAVLGIEVVLVAVAVKILRRFSRCSRASRIRR